MGEAYSLCKGVLINLPHRYLIIPRYLTSYYPLIMKWWCEHFLLNKDGGSEFGKSNTQKVTPDFSDLKKYRNFSRIYLLSTGIKLTLFNH